MKMIEDNNGCSRIVSYLVNNPECLCLIFRIETVEHMVIQREDGKPIT